MKKRLLLPFLLLPLCLTSCKDKHTVEKETKDLTIVEYEFSVGNRTEDRDNLLNAIKNSKMYYIENEENEYLKNYKIPGVYEMEIYISSARHYTVPITVSDTTIPVIEVLSNTIYLKYNTTLDEDGVKAEILKCVNIIDDCSPAKDLIIDFSEDSEFDEYMNNGRTIDSIGTSYSVYLHAWDKAGNEATSGALVIQVTA